MKTRLIIAVKYTTAKVSPNIMYLLTEFEGRKGKYLARGQDV